MVVGDDFAGIEEAPGVEQGLDLGHDGEQLGSDLFGHELGAGDAHAVFSGERGVVPPREGGGLLGEQAEFGDVVRVVQVEQGTHVEESGRGVAVKGSHEAEFAHDRLEFVDVRGEAFGLDRDVLDAGGGFGGPFAAREQGEPRFAHGPDHLHLCRVGDDHAAAAEVPPGSLGDARLGVVLELDDQEGLAGVFVEPEEVARRLERQLAPGLVEEKAVGVFDGGGFGIGVHRGLQGFRDRLKKNHESGNAGEGHDADLGGEYACERAFAAGDDLARSPGARRVAIEPVTRPAFNQNVGEQ